MNYGEISRRVREQDAKFKTGADLMDEFAGSLEKKGLLPKRLEEPRLPQTGSEDLQLRSIVKEYSAQPHTPELVANFWQTFLETPIQSQELDIPVPIVSCDRTQEELDALNKEGRMWVPETKLTYPQLGRIFPKMQSYVLREDSSIKDEFEQAAKGVDVEISIDSPNRDTKEEDLEKLFKSQGRKGIRLSTFILASQASKVLTGKYFDEGVTWSRLLGSRDGGGVVIAHFDSGGHLHVYWARDPKRRDPSIGGRSEGVKKA